MKANHQLQYKSFNIFIINKVLNWIGHFYRSSFGEEVFAVIKPVPFCRRPGPLVAIYYTAWSWDIITVYCLIFRLHYMLLPRLRNHAECERNAFPPPRIDICDSIICQHMQTLHTLHFFDGESWWNGPECIVTTDRSKWYELSVRVCPFLYRSCHLNSLKSSDFHFNSFCWECSQIFKVLYVKAGVCLPAEKVTLWSLKLSLRGIKWMMLMQKVV